MNGDNNRQTIQAPTKDDANGDSNLPEPSGEESLKQNSPDFPEPTAMADSNDAGRGAHVNSDTDFQSSDKKAERHFDVISDLRTMQEGWDGPGTIPPTAKAIDALYQVFNSLQWREEDIPDVQVDDDGTVTMIWRMKNQNLFSVDIFRDGRTLFICTDVKMRKSDSKVIDPYDNQAVWNLYRQSM